MTDTFTEQMERELLPLHLKLDRKKVEQLFIYYEHLVRWNQVMNLTAITDERGVVTKHFVDSLSLVRITGPLESVSLIDVGTGAGFPGLPLKIVFPNLEVTLLDSLNKRVKFLDEMIIQLGLKGIRAVHGRAEDLGRDMSYRRNFDLCVSRAVANLSTLSEYCMPFVKVGGMFVAYKSGEIEDELKGAQRAIEMLGGVMEAPEVFMLPETDVKRSLVKIRKVKDSPKKFPRKAGIPAKEPI